MPPRPAYREAARIAPDRALPYVGLGGVLARLGRSDDSLAAYAAALDRAPDDEGAMQGRADVLAVLGRRAEAADMLDRLAANLERDGRHRRRLRRRPTGARARRIAWTPRPGRAPRLDAQVGGPGRRRGRGGARARARRARFGAGRRCPRDRDAKTSTEQATDACGPAQSTAPDPALLTLAVEESLEAGDLDEARRRALIAANGHRAVGQFHAAMDACYQGLAIMPSDPDIHLLLAELYLDRGWRGPAADKLVLLGRLSQLTGDGATRGRLCYLAAARFPDDPRLAAVCA